MDNIVLFFCIHSTLRCSSAPNPLDVSVNLFLSELKRDDHVLYIYLLQFVSFLRRLTEPLLNTSSSAAICIFMGQCVCVCFVLKCFPKVLQILKGCCFPSALPLCTCSPSPFFFLSWKLLPRSTHVFPPHSPSFPVRLPRPGATNTTSYSMFTR